MFGRFGKKKPEPPPVTAWMRADDKFQAIATAVKTSGASHVVVAHFPETLRRIEQAFLKNAVEVETASSGKIFGVLTFLKEARGRKATIALSDVFPSTPSEASTEKIAVEVVVAELYPTPERDAALQELLRPFGVGLRYYAALDDAMMKRFGSDQIIETLKKLGGDETEPIEHELITKSLLNAQEKIKASVKSDFNADSAEAWFKKNFPDKAR